ncbi:Clavaminate synthase-like protein [Zopfia rhizophila CBS 207.26]|uniref:Clavaminate synthase-like protein n=1 Tax=Zopfia rhizophila CBS 207.26 TaxID=1314779 RepID=A0A6A6DZ18_9PEZI|nr:Clavaminate synthase-like protein [Zopfia rhizophila CBS 207.26]
MSAVMIRVRLISDYNPADQFCRSTPSIRPGALRSPHGQHRKGCQHDRLVQLGSPPTPLTPYNTGHLLPRITKKKIQIIQGSNEPAINFPLILQPSREELSKEAILKEARALGAQPSDKTLKSPIRQLLDANGGAIHLKGLPLKTAEDFSEFMFALAGSGPYAWRPHEHTGMEVLRRPQALNVLTANEGPPSHFIGWHNEYAVSPVHPHYLALFCKVPPAAGGETSVCNSIALYDRLKTDAPSFVEGCGKKGVVYQIPHNADQVGGIVGGNGLYKDSAFGPKGDEKMPGTEEGKRAMVERKILDLAHRGGWHKDINQADERYKDADSGTQALSTRYTNAVANDTFNAPFTFKKEDGTEGISIPPHFAGLEKDEPIPREWLQKMDEWQHELESSIVWDAGDVLLVDVGT